MKVELTKDDLGIRSFRADDTLRLYEAVRESLAELRPWMPWAHPDYSIKESESWVLAREPEWNADIAYGFVIFDVTSGDFLGTLGLNKIDRMHQSANLGYWVRTGATRRGAATTATRLLARFGLEQLGFQRLEIVASVKNHASQRVAEKAGAQREGILRKALLYHGVPHDAVLYSLIAEDINW